MVDLQVADLQVIDWQVVLYGAVCSSSRVCAGVCEGVYCIV